MTNDPDDELKGSEVRLWNLIAQRTAPGADVARIDQRIWDLFGDEMAVMFTDLAGFSRQVSRFGIVHFLQEIYEQKRLLLPVVAQHDGILVKVEADSFLIVFRRARSAIECAVAMQRVCQGYNRRRTAEDQVLLCVGIGYGRMLRIGDRDVYGAQVNAASKLGEDTAGPNEILVTADARASAGEVTGVGYTKLDCAVPGSDENYRVEYPLAL